MKALRKSLALSVVGVGGACLAGLVVGTGASFALTGTSKVVEVPPASVAADADYNLDVLSTVATADDILPDIIPVADIANGLDAASSRLVEDGETQSYVVKSSSGLLCLLVLVPGEDWVSGTTCATPESFTQHGLGIVVNAVDEDRTVERYLVSDVAVGEIPGIEGVGFGEAKNLITVDAEISKSSRQALSDSSSLPSLEVLSNVE